MKYTIGTSLRLQNNDHLIIIFHSSKSLTFLVIESLIYWSLRSWLPSVVKWWSTSHPRSEERIDMQQQKTSTDLLHGLCSRHPEQVTNNPRLVWVSWRTGGETEPSLIIVFVWTIVLFWYCLVTLKVSARWQCTPHVRVRICACV